MNKIILIAISLFGLLAIIIGIFTWTYWNITIGLMLSVLAYVTYKYD